MLSSQHKNTEIWTQLCSSAVLCKPSRPQRNCTNTGKEVLSLIRKRRKEEILTPQILCCGHTVPGPPALFVGSLLWQSSTPTLAKVCFFYLSFTKLKSILEGEFLSFPCAFPQPTQLELRGSALRATTISAVEKVQLSGARTDRNC